MMLNPMPEANCARSRTHCPPCNKPRSRQRGVVSIALAICIVLAVVWGEVWAIEHGSELAVQCSPEHTNSFARAFDVGCGATTAPIAIIH